MHIQLLRKCFEYWKCSEIIESQGHICIAFSPKCDQMKEKCHFIGCFVVILLFIYVQVIQCIQQNGI